MRDITVFGRYTYLVTEIVWGLVAALLLRRANALRKAAVTILALYPIAYVWDRYTLAVGVFDIKLRIGIDIAGIPLEEHLFMAVVPGLVIGIHETIFGDESDEVMVPAE
ncbi:lycopene cyclase domain-containing protein [Natrinema zhouii]|uniref:Lycopene cyclase domain-containing protein n=1 Tax=Natrinema zhouii TaxID=1710539 RepID=A0A7D6CPK8_9EURY|nr:lycopene cyclase domain-containing protein [Natrinema zhouii]QLK26912.1 lycopene cyclase domain-containing protein [Natrinema zhouii]